MRRKRQRTLDAGVVTMQRIVEAALDVIVGALLGLTVTISGLALFG